LIGEVRRVKLRANSSRTPPPTDEVTWRRYVAVPPWVKDVVTSFEL
jgi:hypothetical protein